MGRITFEDKEDVKISSLPEKNTWKAADIKMVKDSINALYDLGINGGAVFPHDGLTSADIGKVMAVGADGNAFVPVLEGGEAGVKGKWRIDFPNPLAMPSPTTVTIILPSVVTEDSLLLEFRNNQNTAPLFTLYGEIAGGNVGSVPKIALTSDIETTMDNLEAWLNTFDQSGIGFIWKNVVRNSADTITIQTDSYYKFIDASYCIIAVSSFSLTYQNFDRGYFAYWALEQEIACIAACGTDYYIRYTEVFNPSIGVKTGDSTTYSGLILPTTPEEFATNIIATFNALFPSQTDMILSLDGNTVAIEALTEAFDKNTGEPTNNCEVYDSNNFILSVIEKPTAPKPDMILYPTFGVCLSVTDTECVLDASKVQRLKLVDGLAIEFNSTDPFDIENRALVLVANGEFDTPENSGFNFKDKKTIAILEATGTAWVAITQGTGFVYAKEII